MARERTAATGLAIPFPAMSGAVPWAGWKTAWASPMSAEGAMPMPPTSPAARSGGVAVSCQLTTAAPG